MAIATNAMKEVMALQYGTTAAWVSVHLLTGPGSTGANEQTLTGTPAYARKQTTWAGGAVDGQNIGNQVTIDLPAGTYTWIGLWSAVTGGTFYDGYQLGTQQTFATQGQLLVTPTFTQT